MPRINEATDTDLKVVEILQRIGWKRGDTLLYQQEYKLLPEQQKQFEGKKSIKPDIVLQDLNGNVLAVFENKFEDEKKALTKLRSLYTAVLKPRFLYACLDNMLSEKVIFSETLLIQQFYEWSEEKKKFSEKEVKRVFLRMKETGIIPKGYNFQQYECGKLNVEFIRA